MSAEDQAQAGEAPRIVGADGLTNKERRLAKQAEKRKRAEEESKDVVTKEQSSTPAAAAVDTKAEQNVEQEDDDEGEVEALSHKEKRKRRKLEKKGLLPSDAPSEHTGGASSSTSGLPPLPARSAFALWVGNMNFMTSPERLQSWFEDKGIQGISRVHMPKGMKKFEQNKGFAYVDVPSAEAVKEAVALSEQNLDGRRLLIKSASDFTGRPAIDPTAAALAQQPPSGEDAESKAEAAMTSAGVPGSGGKTGLTKTAQKILRSQKHQPGPTLFVGNLSFNSTKESLQEMLERSAFNRLEWSEAAALDRKRKAKAEAIAEKKAKRKAKAKAKAKKAAKDEEGSDSDSDEEEEKKEEAKSDSDSSSDSDSDSDSDSSDSSDTPASEPEQDPAKAVGIRKIRMGEFEDTGKCKGFAFIDFESAGHATASLIDPHNYRLDGRELKMEFAGVDAIRRGASKDLLPAALQSREGSGGRGGRGGGRGGSRGGRGGGRFGDDRPPRRDFSQSYGGDGYHSQSRGDSFGGDDTSAPVVAEGRPGHKETQAERHARREREGPKRRAKPGAALANAQRGKTGIDTSGVEGKKMVFD